MAMITAEEQLALRNKAKAELQRLETVDADLVNRFKAKYGVCEIVYKVILADHQMAKGKSVDYLKVIMTQVPYALNFAGYDFDKTLLEKLFGANAKPGTMSAKKLRDALTHSMYEAAINELRSREAELFGDMEAFLNKIRTYDDVMSNAS